MCERTKMCAHMPDTIPAYAQVCARVQMRIFFMHACMRIFFHACTTTRYNMHALGHAAQSSMRTQHAHQARICALRHCIIPTDAQISTYSRTYATSYTAHACMQACMDAHARAEMPAYSPSHARASATSSPHMRRYAQICADMRDAHTLSTSCTHLCIHPNAHTTLRTLAPP